MPEVGGRKTGEGLANMKRTVFNGSGVPVVASGNERERSENDWYPTDRAAVKAVFMKNPPDIKPDVPCSVLDPGAGTGVWGEVLREMYPRSAYPLLVITGFELNPHFRPNKSYDQWIVGNFIYGPEIDEMVKHGDKFDLIIGNPPFELDCEFLAQSIRLVSNSGRIDFLYRLGFLAAEERVFSFFGRGYAVSLALIFNTRPSFLPPEEQKEKGKATYPGDFTLYSWRFVGGKADQAKRFDHLVYRTCKHCDRVFFPASRSDRACDQHSGKKNTPLNADESDFKEYVVSGYLRFLNKSFKRAIRMKDEELKGGDVDKAQEYLEKAEKLDKERMNVIKKVWG